MLGAGWQQAFQRGIGQGLALGKRLFKHRCLSITSRKAVTVCAVTNRRDPLS